MRRREVHLCTAAPKTARDAVKALYESKLKAREAKRVAEIAAVGAVDDRGSDKKKSRMSDFYGDDAACANQAADEAISLFFAALHVPEHHADHPLWRNVVSSIQRAGPNYVAPKRRYIGGAGLAKCRQRIEAALAPISASWCRDGVTVASDMFSDKAGRPQARHIQRQHPRCRVVDARRLTEDIRDFLDEHAEGVLTSNEVGDIREIVQDRWDNGLACNLHVIGRILYPTNQEECIFRTDLECMRVFKQYVSKHHGDKMVTRKDGVERRASLVIQEGLNAFLNLQGSFGMSDAIADRKAVKEGKMTAVDWWTWHGTDHPELTTMACRAITQPVSASPCERNWAKFDAVHTARRNRLGAVKLRDLVYVTHKAPEGLGW
ncbi:unnamed protein product [Closterium sp. NIES-65]|nr:unnamed protein product [Closterium sp. NIES-65]